MKFYQISIDGPSGVGKSTIAKELAKQLGFLNVNSGNIFRGIAWYMLKKNISSELEAIRKIEELKELEFKKNQCYFNKKKLDEKELKKSEISILSSKISKVPEIRNFILRIERKLAEKENLVMEGRDIGTSVFPNAFLKIYLTADLDARANWRYQELKKLKILDGRNYQEIKEELMTRDKNDLERELSPLKKAKDALEIESSNKSIDELVSLIKKVFLEKKSKLF